MDLGLPHGGIEGHTDVDVNVWYQNIHQTSHITGHLHEMQDRDQTIHNYLQLQPCLAIHVSKHEGNVVSSIPMSSPSGGGMGSC